MCTFLLRKKRESGCHILSLVGFLQCVGYPFTHRVRLGFEVQINFDCFIRNLNAFSNLSTGSLSSSVTRFRPIKDRWPANAWYIANNRNEIVKRIPVHSRHIHNGYVSAELCAFRHLRIASITMFLMCSLVRVKTDAS